MTIDEHMALKYLIMNVRDELQDQARRDVNIRHYVADLEQCLAILRRKTVLQALEKEEGATHECLTEPGSLAR